MTAGDSFYLFFQVRVVRFYKSCPLPPLPPLPLLLLVLFFAVIFAVVFCCNGQRRISIATCRSQWAAPGLKGELVRGVGSAGPQRGAPDCGQRRAGSAGARLPSGVGSAGPRPGSFRAGWAAPVLSRQKRCQKERQKIGQKKCQKICQKKCPKKCQKIRSEKKVRRYARRYVRRNVRRNARK